MAIRTRLARFLRGERRYLFAWLVILAAIAVRVGWAAWVAHAYPEAVTKGGDTPSYLGPARALLDTGASACRHRRYADVPAHPRLSDASRRDPLVTNSQWSISPIQAELSLLTVQAVVVVGRRTIGPTAGLIAGVFVALDPLQFAASGTILTESLASFMLVGVAAAGVPVFMRRPERVRVRPRRRARGIDRRRHHGSTDDLLLPGPRRDPAHAPVLASAAPFDAAFCCMAFVLPDRDRRGWLGRPQPLAVNSWQFSGAQAVTLYCWHGAAVEARATRRSGSGTPGNAWSASRSDSISRRVSLMVGVRRATTPRRRSELDEMGSRGTQILVQHLIQATEVMVQGLVREIAGPGTERSRKYLHLRSSPPLDRAALVVERAPLVTRARRRHRRVALIAPLVLGLRHQHHHLRPRHIGGSRIRSPNASAPRAPARSPRSPRHLAHRDDPSPGNVSPAESRGDSRPLVVDHFGVGLNAV